MDGQYATLSRAEPDDLADTGQPGKAPAPIAVDVAPCGYVNERLVLQMAKVSLSVMPCDRLRGHPGFHHHEVC